MSGEQTEVVDLVQEQPAPSKKDSYCVNYLFTYHLESLVEKELVSLRDQHERECRYRLTAALRLFKKASSSDDRRFLRDEYLRLHSELIAPGYPCEPDSSDDTVLLFPNSAVGPDFLPLVPPDTDMHLLLARDRVRDAAVADLRCFFEERKAKYLVAGLEVAPTTGALHMQGFVVFSSRVRFSHLKKAKPLWHWEAARGTPEQNYLYCTKTRPGDVPNEFVVEFGTQPTDEEGWRGTGKRESDRWRSAYEYAKVGAFDSVDPQIAVSYFSSLLKIRSHHSVQSNDLSSPCAYWYWGVTGSGKTHAAYLGRDPDTVYRKNANKWWDGYDPARHSVVVIDDITPDTAKYLGPFILRWCDKYAFLAEIKGGSLSIRPSVMIVTSNYTLEQCFAVGSNVDISALQRRFVREHFPYPYKEGVVPVRRTYPAGYVGDYGGALAVLYDVALPSTVPTFVEKPSATDLASGRATEECAPVVTSDGDTQPLDEVPSTPPPIPYVSRRVRLMKPPGRKRRVVEEEDRSEEEDDESDSD